MYVVNGNCREKKQFWIWIISFLHKALEDIKFMAGNDLQQWLRASLTQTCRYL